MPVLNSTQRQASLYRWTIPANTIITNSNSDSSTIALTYNTGFNGGSLIVKGQSACGIQSAARTQVLVYKLPATPSTITSSTGNLSGCISGTINYSVTAGTPSSLQTTTSVYRWTIPANTTITSASNIAGIDSAQITLSFGSGYTSGTLSVRGQTACGALGTIKSASLIAPYIAPTPTSITSSVSGNFNGCIGATKTFTAATTTTPSSTQSAATKYRWTIPANTTIASASAVGGVDSASITLQFNTGYSGGTLSVRGITACEGISAARTQSLTHVGCPIGSGALFTKNTQNDINSFEAILYPNPTKSDFRINMNNVMISNEKIIVKVFDLQGRMMETLGFISINNISFGKNLKPGIYMVHISQGKETQTKRVVKY